VITRRAFAASLVAPALRGIPRGVRLIAHRGGVVDAQRPENSPGAVSAAIERGYWMIEVDVRRTRDGEPVLHHDATLEKYYGTAQRPEDLTWAELRKLQSKPGGKAPLHFEELCAMCGGKTRLMLDLKAQWDTPFYQRLLRLMVDGKIPEPIWSLGGPRVHPLFDGRVMVSVNSDSLKAALKAGEPVSERYFLFELGSDLDRARIDFAREAKVTPVAAINTFRYTMAKRDEWLGPKEDIAKLRSLGVECFQVDSRYESLFTG
jgi:glycerophosphoryl diester phosphodiesterase